MTYIITFYNGIGGYGKQYGISGISHNRAELEQHIIELNKLQNTQGSHASSCTYKVYEIKEIENTMNENVLFTVHY